MVDTRRRGEGSAAAGSEVAHLCSLCYSDLCSECAGCRACRSCECERHDEEAMAQRDASAGPRCGFCGEPLRSFETYAHTECGLLHGECADGLHRMAVGAEF